LVHIYLNDSFPTTYVRPMWFMKDEFEEIRKEAVVTQFKVVSRHSRGRDEENHENPRSGYPAPGPRFEPGTSRIWRSANHSTATFFEVGLTSDQMWPSLQTNVWIIRFSNLFSTFPVQRAQ
jgi:hypothetical protein